MDVLLAVSCSAAYWFALHLSLRDVRFFAWCVKDIRKAALDDNIYISWRENSALFTRLLGHGLIWACVLTAVYREGDSLSSPFLDFSYFQYLFWSFVRAFGTSLVLFIGPITERLVLRINEPLLPSTSLLTLERIVAPTSEELFFRLALFRLLRARLPQTQVFIGAGCFALLHIPKFCYFLADDIRIHRITATEKSEPRDRVDDAVLRGLLKNFLTQVASGVVLTFCFAVVVGSVYVYLYNSDISHLIVIHWLCNCFGVPQFLSSRHGFIPRCVVSVSYIAGVAFWWRYVL